MGEAWIIDSCRTPRGIGKPGKGGLSSLHPQRLGATVLEAIASRNNLNTADVDDVIFGTGQQVGTQGYDLARMSALDAGYDVAAPGITIDRFCGSGLSACSLAAATVMADFNDVVIAGGAEQMSSYRANRAGAQQFPFLDSGNAHLRTRHPQTHQGVAADAIATIEAIPRSVLDALAAESQARADRAVKEGRFDRSLVPVVNEDGSIALDREEYPRPGTTAEMLAALPPSFAEFADVARTEEGDTYRSQVLRKFPGLAIDHVHHAGNSSGIVDGAAAVLIASPGYAQAHDLVPRARIVASATVGDDPTLMLNAPVPAARQVLKKAGLAIEDIDVFEVNEAFAVVSEKFMRDLDLDRRKVNVNGGAIALGHPIGATGAMLVGTALDELERQDGQFALITMCTGGGMAPAVIIERI